MFHNSLPTSGYCQAYPASKSFSRDKAAAILREKADISEGEKADNLRGNKQARGCDTSGARIAVPPSSLTLTLPTIADAISTMTNSSLWPGCIIESWWLTQMLFSWTRGSDCRQGLLSWRRIVNDAHCAWRHDTKAGSVQWRVAGVRNALYVWITHCQRFWFWSKWTWYPALLTCDLQAS